MSLAYDTEQARAAAKKRIMAVQDEHEWHVLNEPLGTASKGERLIGWKRVTKKVNVMLIALLYDLNKVMRVIGEVVVEHSQLAIEAPDLMDRP
mmetsp:Transcript_30253/g.63520  ORF Transcript_30253/g.63520 Transcript_30253/m.63520 type:complete len:93 (+) Transcript_30253:53-331(+)